MTDSVGQAADKRERLISGARQVLHENGVEASTLADIATAADVPLGNVYYYFKTKDELVNAAIDAHAADIELQLRSFERQRTPKARLKAFVRALTEQRDLVSRHGCPHGTLCSELAKRGDSCGDGSPKLMQLSIDWAERQFREFGRRDARDLAVALIASYQGIALLTNAFHDPKLMEREGRRLARWIDQLT